MYAYIYNIYLKSGFQLQSFSKWFKVTCTQQYCINMKKWCFPPAQSTSLLSVHICRFFEVGNLFFVFIACVFYTSLGFPLLKLPFCLLCQTVPGLRFKSYVDKQCFGHYKFMNSLEIFLLKKKWLGNLLPMLSTLSNINAIILNDNLSAHVCNRLPWTASSQIITGRLIISNECVALFYVCRIRSYSLF